MSENTIVSKNIYNFVEGVILNKNTDIYTRTGVLAGFPLGDISTTYSINPYYTCFDTTPDISWHMSFRGGYVANGTSARVFYLDPYYGISFTNSSTGGRFCL